MKKRVNITIGPNLHREATNYADKRETDFSSLVAEALRAFMAANPLPVSVGGAIQRGNRTEQIAAGSGGSHAEIPFKAFPTRNEPCPCGSGAKYKKCCEKVSGPSAMKLNPPEGFRRLDRMPIKGELCPCGSGFNWDICCKAHLPFVEVRKVS